MALLAMRGLVPGPRPEQDHPIPTERRQRGINHKPWADRSGFALGRSASATMRSTSRVSKILSKYPKTRSAKIRPGTSTHHGTVCGYNVGYTTWHSYTELRTRNPLRSGHAQQFDHLISHHKFLRFPSYGHWQLINDANVSRYLKVRNLALTKIFQTSLI